MDKRKQDLFAFARMTQVEYRDDLQQLRIPGVELAEMQQLDRAEIHRSGMASLDDSD